MSYTVLGIDPGPSTGMAIMTYDAGPDGRRWEWTVLQVNGAAALELLGLLTARYHPVMIAVEAFIPSNRAGTKGRGAEVTRNIVGEIKSITGIPVKSRPAAEVKPWASDKRLDDAKFPMKEKTAWRHARDAGRHALYAFCRDGGGPDPLA